MESLRRAISDFLSLIIPKENEAYYTWPEIAIGFALLLLLIGAITLLPR